MRDLFPASDFQYISWSLEISAPRTKEVNETLMNQLLEAGQSNLAKKGNDKYFNLNFKAESSFQIDAMTHFDP